MNRSHSRQQQGWIRAAALVLVLVAAALAVWYLRPQWIPAPVLDRLPSSPAAVDSARPAPMLYRWRDADGSVHFNDQPPPEGVEFELVPARENINVMPSGVDPSGRPGQ